MPIQRSDITRRWRTFRGLGRAHFAVTALAALLGGSLIAGGPVRASADSFATIRAVGGVTIWGLILIGGSVALLIAASVGRRSVQAALFVGSLVHGLLALWFFQAAQASPVVSWWGCILFAGTAFWHMSQALEYGRDT